MFIYVVVGTACLAVLGAVLVLAVGRGGELAPAQPETAPPLVPAGERVVPSDVTSVRLPRGLWGYHPVATQDTVRWFATTLAERDARIATLETEVADLRGDDPPPITRADRWTDTPAATRPGDTAGPAAAEPAPALDPADERRLQDERWNDLTGRGAKKREESTSTNPATGDDPTIPAAGGDIPANPGPSATFAEADAAEREPTAGERWDDRAVGGREGNVPANPVTWERGNDLTGRTTGGAEGGVPASPVAGEGQDSPTGRSAGEPEGGVPLTEGRHDDLTGRDARGSVGSAPANPASGERHDDPSGHVAGGSTGGVPANPVSGASPDERTPRAVPEGPGAQRDGASTDPSGQGPSFSRAGAGDASAPAVPAERRDDSADEDDEWWAESSAEPDTKSER
ncbi:hypothetical protein [Actinomadura flavalba]|uniref:hypothetical protein n=1 Tax=Actinomadura flavalba TaxID=1120938 RepID=UPI00036D1594|nr:hypothetical protein [Actinomadura flavalba]